MTASGLRAAGSGRLAVPTALLAASLASGCATVYEAQWAFDDGWRTGHVVATGSASEVVTTAHSDCRLGASAAQIAQGRFALVAYRFSRQRPRRIVALPGGTPFEAGEAVYVNVKDCRAPLIRASTQVSTHRTRDFRA